MALDIVYLSQARNKMKLCMIWSSRSGGYEKYYRLEYNAVSLMNVNGRFETIFRLHFQVWRIGPAKWCIKNDAGGKQMSVSSWCLSWLIIRPWRWKLYIPPKSQLNFNGLLCVISQMIVLFIMKTERNWKILGISWNAWKSHFVSDLDTAMS
jgi:hypothetical protein